MSDSDNIVCSPLVWNDLIPHGYQGAVMVVLPVWRFTAKRFVVYFLRDRENLSLGPTDH
jgi:hypothetical protein